MSHVKEESNDVEKSPHGDDRALSGKDMDRIIQMAWEDRTAFDTITVQFGLSEAQVIKLMRKTMKRASFEIWRRRVSGRKTKHLALRESAIGRFKSTDQKGW